MELLCRYIWSFLLQHVEGPLLEFQLEPSQFFLQLLAFLQELTVHDRHAIDHLSQNEYSQ